jgi:hypothetical protein
MSNRFVRAFSVGNGNCILVGVGEQNFLFDMHDCDEDDAKECKSAWELVSPWLRKNAEGVRILDVFCNSHGHTDHCGGFLKFKEQIDAGQLIIGEIWHNGHDRLWKESESELKKNPDCLHYLALRKEIERRKSGGGGFGNVQVILQAGATDASCFSVAQKPGDFAFEVLNPSKAEIDKKEKLTNDHSLVMRLRISGLPLLLAGDAESGAWQNFILPNARLKSWAQSSILIVSHHGSFSFFGPNRDEVREADPHPLNYSALDAVAAHNLIVSARERFPTHSDPKKEPPPHYAAYKWYKKWFVENRGASEQIEHPTAWKYTSDADVYIEFDGSNWKFTKAPEPTSKGYLPTGKQPARAGQTYA